MAGLVSLASLEGVWSLAREISHADGTEARMTGTVSFVRAGARLVQTDEGELVLAGGPPLLARRQYQWIEMEGQLECLFEDGRPFHTVPLGEERCETVHLCAPDHYHVVYDFSDWPRWASVWTVTGPHKDYRMVSRHERIG